ncbi:unnamed protein product [Adineta ricciae]|uniref:G-protein coupled receptors family 1 profile domain-containing protein n=1 Tax=Adineta ricciae TaxID=249248 RepID=A0A814ANQ0_ADIRI|nr:unnamed protein product [Adineta ricciae]CAF1188826.1 unnamed protein product [Adineta ricciae]
MVGTDDFAAATASFDTDEVAIPRPIRFWLLLLLDIPSIICTFFILYHLLIDRNLRWQLNNHSTIILLLFGSTIQLIDIPLNLDFIANSGRVKPSNSILCRCWWIVDIGFYNGITIIMAWSAFERHILVFRDQWVSTRKRRFLLHYLPLIILLCYIYIFYVMVIFFPPCQNRYNYTLPVCNNFPCYLHDPILGKWDSCVNNIFPTVLISLFVVALVLRVYRQKRRLNQPIQWRKQRKLIIQLVPISVLYLIVNIPLNFLIFVHLCGVLEQSGGDVQLTFDFLGYLLILIFPFVNLASISELRKKTSLQRLFSMRTQRRVATTAHT